MSDKTFIQIENNIALLYLNSPENRNAISRSLLNSFDLSLDNITSNKNIRVLIITSSNDKAFCAGADLKERALMTENDIIQFLDNMKKLFLKLENFPIPTIAAINGDAYGGGLEMALSCDIRIISEHAKIGLTETKLGIIPGAGGTQRLTRIIGESKTKELIFTARRINSIDAEKFGIVNYAYSKDSMLEKSILLAKEISTSAPIAVSLAKLAITEGIGNTIVEALDIERKYYLKTLDTKDRKEALVAFKEKREPIFKGE
ncbi:MAG: enoyl-CoA hydratase-related protein [Leptospiraceae bacterium]|nr:enoyl-CoA hydratase/isomerase family protein [Leptospiraceae bacterium]MCK6380047.1 enoyl-CoA hydratase-related protein [Leptospiraceae bacterium]